MTTRDDVLFIAELAVRYHRRRASFLDLLSSSMSLATVIGGAGAFLSLLGNGTTVAKIATLLLTIVGTIQVVFRVDACAAQQKQWLKDWLQILREVRIIEAPSCEIISGWIKRRYDIEAECVFELRALQVDCYYRTASALGLDAGQSPLRWWHRSFIQVWSFEGRFAAEE